MVNQKIVMKVMMEDSKKRSKALRSAVGSPGVISVSVYGDKIVVEGDGIDPVALTATFRKRMGCVELVSVAAKNEKKEEKETKPVDWPYHIQVAPPYTAYGYHQPNYEPSCNTL